MKLKFAAIALGLALSTTASATVVTDARQLLASGDAGIALVQLDAWLAEHPKDAEARFMRAMALSRLDRKPEAIRAFTELIKDVPQYPEPYNNLGVLLAGMGDYAKARTAFESAIAKNPQYTAALQNLENVNVAMAMQADQQVLAKDPANSIAQAKVDLLRSGHGAAPQPAPAAVAAQPALASAAATATAAPVEGAKAAPPVPAASPAPAANAEVGAAAKAVASVLRDWADAWIKQDVKRFFDHYAKNFVPAGGGSAVQWLEDRRHKILAPKKIDLRIEDLKITMTGTRQARISFRELYRSNLSSKGRTRTMEMSNVDGNWMISSEHVSKETALSRSELASLTPAATPVESPKPAGVASANAAANQAGDAITATLEDWADAWTKQDVKRFLGHYANDFTPANGIPAQQWREDRRRKILAPKKIDLKIEDLKLSMSGAEQVRISFHEVYRSNLSTRVRNRTMELRNSGDSWKIVSEKVEGEIVQAPSDDLPGTSPSVEGATTAATAPTKAEAAAAADSITASVRDWADAWTKQDVQRFLNHYSESFTPPDGLSLEQWRAQRRSSIARAKKINLTIEDVKLAMLDERHARVSFRQTYQSDLLSDVLIRTLDLRNVDSRWLIESEKKAKPSQSKQVPGDTAGKRTAANP
ncbi:L,D-transpeptidase Cds6 family protein [Solimonas sp. K1W22B-7]|uniref:L,D-transpeptidase Cds6 family protein n=1 Tax=Solimonas sp. K1W22B-7 TaxID=2303331 RepID=UPI0013C4C8E5|nr:tetratricopeptide repeat protein [Solimonas sp. K1W22B-7]